MLVKKRTTKDTGQEKKEYQANGGTAHHTLRAVRGGATTYLGFLCLGLSCSNLLPLEAQLLACRQRRDPRSAAKKGEVGIGLYLELKQLVSFNPVERTLLALPRAIQPSAPSGVELEKRMIKREKDREKRES